MARRTDSVPGTKIYVGNLPWSMDENEVEQHFTQFGPVVDKIIIKDRETQRSKGFGFITFADAQAATTAMNSMNGQDIGGRAIRVNLANDKAGSGSGTFGGGAQGGGGGYGGASGGGYGGGGGHYGGSGGAYNGSYGAPQGGYASGAPAYGGAPAPYGGGGYGGNGAAGYGGGYPPAQQGGYSQGGYQQGGYQQPPPGSY